MYSTCPPHVPLLPSYFVLQHTILAHWFALIFSLWPKNLILFNSNCMFYQFICNVCLHAVDENLKSIRGSNRLTKIGNKSTINIFRVPVAKVAHKTHTHTQQLLIFIQNMMNASLRVMEVLRKNNSVTFY